MPSASAVVPFHDFREQTREYVGPRNEDQIPLDVSRVAIGWYGPADPAHPVHGDLWTAALLAVDEANSAGGWNGIPFHLLPRWSENPWGSGVSQIARMVYEDDVLAILGSVDGPATHLAEQIVAKARLPLVSPVSTDPSVNLAGVPWMFSVTPADHQWAPPLVSRLVDTVGDGTFALVSMTDHDSRLATRALLTALAALDRGPAFHLELRAGTTALDQHLARLRLSDQTALLVVADATDGARLLSALRAGGFDGSVFGSPRLARRHCLDAAGEAAEGLHVPLLSEPARGGDQNGFADRYRQRTGSNPDWAATRTYDATRILLSAIRTAGLSRVDIRETLVSLSPWEGVSGPIEWDPTGQNRRGADRIGTVRNGSLSVD